MYGDFSRILDNRFGRYSSVLAQQGRYLLDAELNEQNAIVLEYLRRLVTDLLGPFAGPSHRAGFEVTPLVDGQECNGVELSTGHYYVHGLCCEVTPPLGADRFTISLAPRRPPFVVYLHVWEQSVSATQSPDLLDPALIGTPETARRTQVRWQIELGERIPGHEGDLTTLSRDEIIAEFERVNTTLEHRPLMAAFARATSDPEESPTTAAVASPYRGVENQLYRVEVHMPGDAREATFKWSRDNGSVEFGLADWSGEESPFTTTITQATRDPRAGLEPGDWVEYVDDSWSPFGVPAPLLRVESVSAATRQVTLEQANVPGTPRISFDPSLHPILRRWDQQPEESASHSGIPISQAEGTPFELEDGIQIQFDPHDNRYERGDYWVVPARTATGNVLWPRANSEPLALGAQGPTRYLAPLALVHETGEGKPVDLRVRFAPHGHDEQVEHAIEIDPDDRDAARTAEASPRGEQPFATLIRPSAPRFVLRSIGSFASGSDFVLSDGMIRVGRAAAEEIQIDEVEVSRHHATFLVDGERLVVEDADSGNGTFVNGTRIHEPTELHVGDIVALGTEAVQLEVEAPEERSE